MKIVYATARHTWRWTLRLSVVLLLLIGLLVALSWVLLPRIADYRAELEEAISERLHVPVRIERLEARWEGWNPVLRLRGFSLQNPVDGTPLTRFERALATLDLAASLAEGRAQLSTIRLGGGRMILERGTDNQLRFIPQAVGNPPLPVEVLISWLFEVGSLDIQTEALEIKSADDSIESLIFSDFHLSIRNRPNAIYLDLALTPPSDSNETRPEALELSASAATPERFEGRIPELPVSFLAAVGAQWLEPEQSALLADLAPTGRLTELRFELFQDASRYRLTTHVNDFSTRSFGKIPAIEGLDGDLTLDQDGVAVQIDARDVTIDTVGLLRAPVTLTTLSGPLVWRETASGIHLETSGIELANPDLQARVLGSLQLSQHAAGPFIDLNIDSRDMAVGKIPDYLPAAVMGPKLVAWLDQALLAGRVGAGTMVYRGRPGDFPFDDGEGLFETRLQLSDTRFNYFPDWPRIEGLEAEVTFRNRSFNVAATAGKILDVDIARVQADIADLASSPLLIDSRLNGPGAAMLAVLQASPLAAKLSGVITNLRIAGDNTLDLDLDIPFKDNPIKVRGAVGFAGGEVVLPQWDIALERVRGLLGFTEGGLQGKDLQANFRGAPAQFAIETRATGKGLDQTQVVLNTKNDPQALLGASDALLSPYASGQTDWRLTLNLTSDHAGEPVDIALDIDSTLRGLAIELPPPLGKPAAQAQPFSARIRAQQRTRPTIAVDYGESVRAALELTDLADEPGFVRGELRVNAGDAVLPDTKGLTVVARLPHFELPAEARKSALKPPDWLSAIDAHFDELTVYGRRLADVRLTARPQQDQTWRVDIDGKTVAGRLHLPLAPSAATPIQIEFQRLALANNENGEKPPNAAPDPSAFPPLHVAVENLSIDGTPLGQFRLSAMPVEQGVELVDMELRSAHFRVSGNGTWQRLAAGQQSTLKGEFDSPALGKALRDLGYELDLENGPTQASFDLRWAAPFPDFSPEALQGQLRLHIDKGQLLDVEPGVGRVLGLFDLDSLARRLSLDFSDFFSEGFGFDAIDGTMRFATGQALTDDLKLSGPSAEIAVDGRLGLDAQDLDLTITVTPELSSSLSIAGAIAGGPAVGAVLFVADKLLPDAVDRVGRYQYRVTGAWDDPSVQLVQTPVPNPTEQSEMSNR